MSHATFDYDGERLVPDDPRLRNLLVEDLSKFQFASRYVEGRSVLDAGCGAGQGSAHLAGKGARYVVGLDLSFAAVAYARGRYVAEGGARNLAFAEMNATHLAFRDGFFEVVTSIEVVEHLADPQRYLAELRRVLAHDGVLVLSTPNKRISSPTPGSLWPHHVREFHLYELRELLGSGFSQVEMWGLSIPVYDQHPARRFVHLIAPLVKPILPLGLRTRLLPTLQSMIKPHLTLDDIQISQHQVDRAPTLMAVCRV